MSIKQNFPTIDPTLNLDFANSRVVDSRITFTRASAATHTNAQGVLQTVRDNKPRIDFNGNTGECRGLLIEEQRTNLNNDAFLDYDGYYLISTPRSAVAPDGTMTAHKIAASNVNRAGHRYEVYHAVSAATVYTHSIYVKAAGINYFHFFTFQDNNAYTSQSAGFNLSTGVTTTVSAGCTATITAVGNGWYRITATVTSVAATSAGYIAWGLGDISATAFDGNNVDGAYVWGYQREVGTFATSYIPITRTFVSRASSATYYDALGILRTAPANGARYGYAYDSTTGKWVSQGLIIEPSAATNLVDRSTVSNIGSSWQQYNTVVLTTNYSTAPDGSQTAGRITCTSTGTVRVTTGSLVTSTVYSASIWVKSNTGSNYTLTLQIGDTNVVAITATPQWQRFSGFGSPQQNGYNFIDLEGIQAGADISVWGAQLETGYQTTSYIPTITGSATRAGEVSTSAATTRAVDSAVIKPAEFTKLNSSLAATLYGEGTIISGTAASSGVPALVGLSNSVDRDTHRFLLRRTTMTSDASYAGFNYRLATVINGTSYSIDYSAAEGAQPEWEDGAVHKTIFGIDATSQQAYGDGASAGLTSIAIPNFDKFDQVELGNAGSSATWNGHIRKIAYYNKRLSNTQLQALTV
jgi:hypothetical protein